MRSFWTLFRYEMKKLLQNPVARAALVIVLVLNSVTILMGEPGTSYSSHFPLSVEKLRERQEEYAYFAGPITQEWIDHYKAEADAVLHAPQYRVSDQEVERLVQLYTLQYGFTEEKVRSMSSLFLNEAGRAEYDKYEGVAVASDFYKNSELFGDQMAEYYLETSPGKMGACLAAETRARYHALAAEYTAHYNYALGYQKIRNVLTNYPYTVGIVILAALSPLFSVEYTRKTAALLLCTRYGRGRLACAKLAAGSIAALGAWGLVTAQTLALVFPLYGTIGREAFWQDWITAVSPFPWDQGQITVISLLTSLLGALYLALAVMLVSSTVKSQFASLAANGVLLLFPMLDFVFDGVYSINMFYSFLPSRLLMGAQIWQNYDLLYLVGRAVPYQYVVLVAVVAISIGSGFLSVRLFTGRQAEN